MMVNEELTKILKKRKEVEDEDDFNVEICWKQEIDVLTRDIKATIEFFDSECTSDQFMWISEIFEELVEKTQSRILVECLYRNAQRFDYESKDYILMIDTIKLSEAFLRQAEN